MGDLTSLEELVGLVTVTSVQVWDLIHLQICNVRWKIIEVAFNISNLFLIDEWVDERKTYSCCRYKITVGEIHHEGKNAKFCIKPLFSVLC